MDKNLSKLWELVMDRKAWRTEFHGVLKSQTRRSDWTELNLDFAGNVPFVLFNVFLDPVFPVTWKISKHDQIQIQFSSKNTS